MAINFETVAGNQTSANVLAQINNNFAKINSNPVPKADFATNADTVDNKHASELIPGAATFLNSITSLANLSIGRYFCTQARQSWEPVTTTGSRTFLIEVSLDTPNSLKSYKINYIAGAGAGESYYSDYSSGSIRWNRVINNNNVGSVDAVKLSYDKNNNAGKIEVYDDLIYFPETTNGKKGISSQGYFPINDGTGRYFRAVVNVSTISTSHTCDSCGSGYDTYKYRYKLTVYIYNSSFSQIKSITSTDSIDETSEQSGDPEAGICGYISNINTGDIIIPIYTRASTRSGVFYYSNTANTVVYVNSNIKLGTASKNYSADRIEISLSMPDYWYNSHFGQYYYPNYSDNSVVSCHCVQMNDNRSAVTTATDITIGNCGSYGFETIGQVGNEAFLYGGNAVVFKITISSRTIQSVNTGVAIDTYPDLHQGLIDRNGQYLYINLNGTPVKLNLSLTVLNKGTKRSKAAALLETENYIIQYNDSSSASTCYCLNKSNLSQVATYSKAIGSGAGYLNKIYNDNFYCGWYTQTIKSGNGGYYGGVALANNRILNYNTTTLNTADGYYSYIQLREIFQANNGTTIGYFANRIEPSTKGQDVIYKFDGLGCLYRNKIIDDSKNSKMLKAFIYN